MCAIHQRFCDEAMSSVFYLYLYILHLHCQLHWSSFCHLMRTTECLWIFQGMWNSVITVVILCPQVFACWHRAAYAIYAQLYHICLSLSPVHLLYMLQTSVTLLYFFASMLQGVPVWWRQCREIAAEVGSRGVEWLCATQYRVHLKDLHIHLTRLINNDISCIVLRHLCNVLQSYLDSIGFGQHLSIKCLLLIDALIALLRNWHIANKTHTIASN